MKHYEVIVIGSGAGGQTALQDLNQKGLNVALVESSREPGGTCALAGCQAGYTICNKKSIGRMFASIGGCFLGMISVGLAELMEYQLVAKCKVPSPVAVATMILVVVISVLAAPLVLRDVSIEKVNFGISKTGFIRFWVNPES